MERLFSIQTRSSLGTNKKAKQHISNCHYPYRRRKRFYLILHWRVFANPANLWRENRTKSDQVLFSTFFFGNVHRKPLVKHRGICRIFLRNNFSLLGRNQTKQKLPIRATWARARQWYNDLKDKTMIQWRSCVLKTTAMSW